MASLATGFGAIALYLMQRYGRWPYGLLLHTLLLMLVLVLTIISGHRSVWMALGAGIAVLALLGHVPVGKMIKLAVGATFLILVLDTLYANYDIIAFLHERARAFVATREDSTATWRLYIWQDAWEQSKDHLVLGKGLGNYFNVTDHRGLTVRASLHNQYLQFIYQVGLVGLGLYVLFVVAAARQLLVAYRTATSADVAMMTATALVVLVSASVFYLAYGFDFFTWVYVGIGFAAAEQARAAISTRSRAVLRT
jgi:O-antigen ligase